MEGNYLTSGDLAMWESAYTGRRGVDYDSCPRHRGGAATTGIGLAAGLGGGALLLAIAGLWGVNQASKARQDAAMAASAGNTKALEYVANALNRESSSRETWQNIHTPTLTQYVDVRTGAQAGASSLATAEAAALATAINNNSGLNSAIGGCNFLRVARYSAPQPCGCDSLG